MSIFPLSYAPAVPPELVAQRKVGGHSVLPASKPCRRLCYSMVKVVCDDFFVEIGLESVGFTRVQNKCGKPYCILDGHMSCQSANIRQVTGLW